MQSFDDILTKLSPDLPRQPNLVGPVLAKINVRREQRANWLKHTLAGGIGLSLAALILTVTFGNTGKLLWLGLSKNHLVSAHSGLYLRALLEATLIPAITLVGMSVAAGLLIKFQSRLARHAWTALAAVGLTALLTVSASATAVATVRQEPGAVQKELERTINGLGKQEVTVDGHTYELASGTGLTDRQLKAYAEQRAVWEFRKTLDLPTSSSDGGTLAYSARVDTINDTEIGLKDVDPNNKYIGSSDASPTKLVINTKTIFLQGSKPVSRPDLKPGDYIEVATAKDFVTAAYIVKWTYEPWEYSWTPAIKGEASKHRSDGKCYNNETELCPNLPAVVQISGHVEEGQILPADAVIREVFGQIVALDGDLHNGVVKLRTSSGSVWTFGAGYEISHLNLSGYYCPGCPGGSDLSLQVKPGDYLRVEFWQHKSDLGKREVIDQGFQGTKAEAQQLLAEGKLNLHPEIYIRSVEVALKQPWHGNEVPIKFQPQY